MAGGDDTLLGPYDNTANGLALAHAACDNVWTTNGDKYITIMGAGNLQFHIIHIEGT